MTFTVKKWLVQYYLCLPIRLVSMICFVTRAIPSIELYICYYIRMLKKMYRTCSVGYAVSNLINSFEVDAHIYVKAIPRNT